MFPSKFLQFPSILTHFHAANEKIQNGGRDLAISRGLVWVNVTSVSSTKQYIRQDKQYCQPIMGLQVTVQRQVYAFYRHYYQRDRIGGTHTNLHSMTHNIIKSCLKTTVLVHNYINGAISPVQWPDRRSNNGGQPTLASRTPGCNQDNRRCSQPE